MFQYWIFFPFQPSKFAVYRRRLYKNSIAITGFGGQTAFEAAWVDALADQWKDYFVEIKPYLGVANGFLKTGDVDQLRKEVGEPVRDKHFALLEKAAQVGLACQD